MHGDSIRRYARITAVSVKCDYWHTTSRHARITTPLVKSGSRLGEVWGWEDMLESQQSRSNLDRNWLRGMGTVSEGMLESPQSRSNLDQNWLGSIGILPAGMLESQLSWSSLVQDRLGSIGILPAGMLESQQSQSHLAGRYWHTTSRCYIESQHLPLNLDQDWLRGMIISEVSVKSGSKLAGKYQQVCWNHSIIGQIWIKTC